jgi:hypothetical protein
MAFLKKTSKFGAVDVYRVERSVAHTEQTPVTMYCIAELKDFIV